MATREDSKATNQIARDALTSWQLNIKRNVYSHDPDLIHSIQYTFPDRFQSFHTELENFGEQVASYLEPLVNENNLARNLPYLETYDSFGNSIGKVVHHPTYMQTGDIIYQSKLLEKLSHPGGLGEALTLLFLSSQAGEAGHNCPIACSAGIIRVLQKVGDFPNKQFYLQKLTSPSFQTNFTGAQFLTEIQGGSDVGLNATYAEQNKENIWRIYGEKWFCSNAGADLIFVTARYDKNKPGTKGLALFMVPAEWQKHKNDYTIKRLKDKIGTRSMATGEINFHGAYALQMGSLEESFHLVMDNVLHLSRLFNTFSVLGMARRALAIAKAYANHRIAFSHPIAQYPLIKETLAGIKAENTAMLAGALKTVQLQDRFDLHPHDDQKLLLRLLVNLQKYLSALCSVEHIHQALGVLAGNGAIENFSPIPRLLRDCIVCENWEGTHNVLRAQVHKDILKYNLDTIYFNFMHDEIKKLNKDEKRTDVITTALQVLTAEIKRFKQLDPTLQSLQIRLIVDRMTILYCALMLLIEAIHQTQTTSSTSKLDCFDYFALHHLAKNQLSLDKDYLTLLTKINKI